MRQRTINKETLELNKPKCECLGNRQMARSKRGSSQKCEVLRWAKSKREDRQKMKCSDKQRRMEKVAKSTKCSDGQRLKEKVAKSTKCSDGQSRHDPKAADWQIRKQMPKSKCLEKQQWAKSKREGSQNDN